MAHLKSTLAPPLARRIYHLALGFTLFLTLVWLFLLLTGGDGGLFFNGYEVDAAALQRIAVGFVVVVVLYGWLWYRVKELLLRRWVGLSGPDLEYVLSSRMDRPFDLQGLLSRYNEHRLRIVDMIGRRGRALTLAAAYNVYVYLRIASGQEPRYLTAALVDGLLDAILVSWLYLMAFHSSGALGRIVYGAPTRTLDGRLGRANLLSIVTLWNLFKFVMVPLGAQMSLHFPPATYAALFGFIWISYQFADTLAEIVGSLWGRQRLRVWGIGEINRKSVAGTLAAFLGSLAACLWMIHLHDLPPLWLGLALVVSISNTCFELFSPRGSDDFTMATANALICWGFGLLFY